MKKKKEIDKILEIEKQRLKISKNAKKDEILSTKEKTVLINH